MIDAAPPQQPDLPPHLSPEADSERTSRHLSMLKAIAELSMAFVTAIAEAHPPQPKTPPDPAAEPTLRTVEPAERTRTPGAHRLEPARLLADLTRGIRQSIALEAALAEAQRNRIAANAAEAARRAARHTSLQHRRLRNILVQALEDAPEPTILPAKTLFRRFDKCLQDLDLHDDFPNRPLAEPAARICRELHIPFTPRPAHHPPG